MNKFCKSCGKELEDNYKICPYCGEKIEDEIQIENIEKKEENTRICQFCGKSINADFKICPYCSDKDSKISKKSGVVCLLLLIFLFPLWAHRFYAGRIVSALFLLILNGVELFLLQNMGDESIFYSFMIILGIIFLILMIDFIEIIIGRFRDSKGKFIKINN